MFIYAFIIPVIDQLSTIVVQWLENIKGKLMVDAQKLQNEITDIAKTAEEENIIQSTHVIGFQLPDEPDYEEDYDEDDD